NLLLEHGAKIDSGNRDFANMLEWAVKRKEDASFDTVKRLLQFRKNFDDQPFSDPKFGRDLLECAIEQGDFDKAWLLIEKGEDLNGLKEKFKNNALYKDLQRIYLALKSKTNVNIKDENGYTALLSVLKDERIRRVRYDLVKRLLESGANVNASNGRGITALHLAAQEGYAEIAELLIEQGANVNALDDNGDTALLLAVNNKNLGVMNLLLDHGAKISPFTKDYMDMLEEAVKSYKDASFDVVKRLLKSRKNFDDKNFGDPRFGRRLLELAIKNDNFDKAWMLAEKGVNFAGLQKKFRNNEVYKQLLNIYSLLKNKQNINVKDENGDTPLLTVMKNKKIQGAKREIIGRLLEQGADVSVVDKNGYPPLFCATDVQTAELLIKYGADVNYGSEESGFNWLTYLVLSNAISNEGKIPMVKLIYEKIDKKKINEPNDQGNTALHVAARRDYAEIAELLINYGADIHLRNKKGETPLMRTARYGSEKVARVLLSINENTEKTLGVKKISLEEVIEALMIAAENGNKGIVESLLDIRTDIPEDQIREALKKAEDKKRGINQYSVLRQFDNVIKVLKERISGSYESDSSTSSSDSEDEPYHLNKSRSNSQETQESSSSSSDNDE
nr:ankyrin repeat domain-containing protein [Alphaproteobacteria bacterium]